MKLYLPYASNYPTTPVFVQRLYEPGSNYSIISNTIRRSVTIRDDSQELGWQPLTTSKVYNAYRCDPMFHKTC